MGLSLAGSSKKEKISFDPRNTIWSNDTERFGHQHMLNMGWKPGQGLGKSIKGDTQHIKVKVKADNTGLGRPIKDDMPTGLDVFQRILGKLNGEEEKVNRQLNEQMKMSGVFLNFVYGGVLEGTVEKMMLTTVEETTPSTKRAAPEDVDEEVKKSKKAKKEKSKKLKEDDEKEKKNKKDKKGKKDKKDKSKSKSKSKSPPEKSESKSPTPSGIRATRSRFIAMKRQATTDEKSLKEILMLN